MNTFIGWGFSILLFIAGVGIPSGVDAPGHHPQSQENMSIVNQETVNPPSDAASLAREHQRKKPTVNFKWGDVSWLPELALAAGWPVETHEKLAQIVLRESGGCPNRRGGDVVDENCNITGVSEWNHRSDTGLLQINGVNYDKSRNKWAIACRHLGICTQAPLLDPINNLRVGYLLYLDSGWDPWDPCAWGADWAHRCDKKKKP